MEAERRSPSPSSSGTPRPRCLNCGAIADLRCSYCRGPVCRGCAYGDRWEGYVCPPCHEDLTGDDR